MNPTNKKQATKHYTKKQPEEAIETKVESSQDTTTDQNKVEVEKTLTKEIEVKPQASAHDNVDEHFESPDNQSMDEQVSVNKSYRDESENHNSRIPTVEDIEDEVKSRKEEILKVESKPTSTVNSGTTSRKESENLQNTVEKKTSNNKIIQENNISRKITDEIASKPEEKTNSSKELGKEIIVNKTEIVDKKEVPVNVKVDEEIPIVARVEIPTDAIPIEKVKEEVPKVEEVKLKEVKLEQVKIEDVPKVEQHKEKLIEKTENKVEKDEGPIVEDVPKVEEAKNLESTTTTTSAKDTVASNENVDIKITQDNIEVKETKETVEVTKETTTTEEKKVSQPQPEEEIPKEPEVDQVDVDMRKLLASIIALKDEGNKYFKSGQWDKAEESYKKGVDEVEMYLLNNKMSYDQFMSNPKYVETFNEVSKQRKFLFSNMANALQKQKKLMDVIRIDQFIISNIDPYFDKSYVRLISCAIEFKNLDIANYYADLFKKNFVQSTIDTHKEYFILLENANKQAEADKDEFFKKMQKNKKAAEAKKDQTEPQVNNTSTTSTAAKEQLNLSQQSYDTSASTPNKSNSVAKQSKTKKWFNYLFGPAILFTAATGLFFLIKHRNKFR